ncbi:hypothetical protein HMPREF0973_02288 [Prevotella veroralis F0319]|uniref:Uncharacterized protein n=1 Tax=Prevotella veroralis F0319 TaxID=649761 RepID=C9MRM5_9BACT|nr:hypothetical protein HMPREF0973_02288 [Prevotella veroralis F0319]
MPTCRDRRPRLSARAQQIKSLPKSLQGGGCCLTGCQKGVKRRTDEGVCPYIVVLYCTEQTTRLLVNPSTRPLIPTTL